MPESSKKKLLKSYETKTLTWNKGRFGKYKTLSKINKVAFEKSQKSRGK